MHGTLTGPGVETKGNGALDTQENPSWPAAEGAQFFLGSPDSRVKEAAALVCAAVKESQHGEHGFTLGTVASLVGKEVPYVSKCLDVDDPHAALRMLMAAVLLDRGNVILRCMNRMKGCDLVEAKRLTDEEFRRRVEAKARASKSGSAWLDEALGEVEP